MAYELPEVVTEVEVYEPTAEVDTEDTESETSAWKRKYTKKEKEVPAIERRRESFNLFNPDAIAQYLEEAADEAIARKLKSVKIQKIQIAEGPEIDVSNEHPEFKNLLTIIANKLNVALVGPAGTGKTTAAIRVAELLWKKFYSISVWAQTGKHEFFGYQDATGNYIRTLFREAYEHGGIFLIDEFDAGNANVLTSVNQALSNGMCPFPDGMIPKHEDFVCIVAGNTYGLWGDGIYSGRSQIDGATLDRFVFVNWTIDEKLEESLSMGEIAWYDICKKARKNAEKNDLQVIIWNRTIMHGAKLLKSGLPLDKVIDMCLVKGISQDERTMLLNF